MTEAADSVRSRDGFGMQMRGKINSASSVVKPPREEFGGRPPESEEWSVEWTEVLWLGEKTGACLDPWLEGGARVPHVARVDRGTHETVVRGWPVRSLKDPPISRAS